MSEKRKNNFDDEKPENNKVKLVGYIDETKEWPVYRCFGCGRAIFGAASPIKYCGVCVPRIY